MKIAVIGATGTIGRKVCERLKTDHDVIQVGYKSGDYHVDIADKASITHLFEQLGNVDAIICTTGLSAFAPLQELTDEQFELSFNNKVMGQINILRIGQHHLRTGGVIVLTTGVLADHPIPGSAATSAANGAVNAFVKAAALELKDKLRINAVSPAFITESLQAIGADSSQGVSAADTATVYEKVVTGSLSGQIIDVRNALSQE